MKIRRFHLIYPLEFKIPVEAVEKFPYIGYAERKFLLACKFTGTLERKNKTQTTYDFRTKKYTTRVIPISKKKIIRTSWKNGKWTKTLILTRSAEEHRRVTSIMEKLKNEASVSANIPNENSNP